MTEFLEELHKDYYKKNGFNHKTASKVRLYPFSTTSLTANELNDLKDFKGITGEVIRILGELQTTTECTSEIIIQNLKQKVDSSESDFLHLKHIIETVAFDETKTPHCFHPHVYPYLSFSKSSQKLRPYSQFIVEILFENQSGLYECLQQDNKDISVLHSLILESFPELKKNSQKKETHFHRVEFDYSNVFQHDFKFICSDLKLCTKNLIDLVKFYTLIYQFKTLEYLNLFFEEKEVSPYFFSLEWESLSKTREAYQWGWQRIENVLDTLYSHVNCLELLNYLPVPGIPKPITYSRIKKWTTEVESEKKEEVSSMLDKLITFYKNGIINLEGDPNFWADFTENSKYIAEPILHNVLTLWDMINYQFQKSSRKGAAKRYSSWISSFAIENFVKRRGRIGNTLSLKREHLMLLTRICLGKKEKLRLKELWKEFEKRGVAFDSDSRHHIITLYEKLNILEKKSDSGDAQYVRAIF